jgi:hypothetical protein
MFPMQKKSKRLDFLHRQKTKRNCLEYVVGSSGMRGRPAHARRIPFSSFASIRAADQKQVSFIFVIIDFLYSLL